MLSVCEASVTTNQISTFSNIYRHISPLLTLYHLSPSLFTTHLMSHAQYTWSSYYCEFVMAKLLPFHLKCNLYTQAPQGRLYRYKVMVLQHILRSIFVLLAFQSVHIGPCDLMDKGSDFGSGDCRFESCHGQCFSVRTL